MMAPGRGASLPDGDSSTLARQSSLVHVPQVPFEWTPVPQSEPCLSRQAPSLPTVQVGKLRPSCRPWSCPPPGGNAGLLCRTPLEFLPGPPWPCVPLHP